jgi:shikimate kinase
MGAGKTVVGRRLAERLGRTFVDTDAEIERRSGATITEIFRERGEAEFRTLEREAIARACALDSAVVATGGGAFVPDENRARMKASGAVVYLSADPGTLLARVGGGDDRPLLAGAPDRLERIRELLTARAAAYAEADWEIDTTSLAPDAVVHAILTRLAERGQLARLVPGDRR